MNLTFNIIYTPGSVKFLSFFVWSLLKWTSVSFRLVSNGCLYQEQRYLADLCRHQSRLEYWAIPTKTCLAHGQALNYLQALTRDECFCFMDSDIFATGDFVADMMLYQHDHVGVFTGMPVWVKSNEELFPLGFRSMTGMFNHTSQGLVLGSTFCAVYNNQRLNQAMQSTGIGFEEYRWQELAANVQHRISGLGLAVNSFDTGKILNLLLLSDGENLINLKLDSICHIGGTSFQVLSDDFPKGFKTKVLEFLPNKWIQGSVNQYKSQRAVALCKEKYLKAPESELELNVSQRLTRRNPARQYYLSLLNSLFMGRKPPSLLVTGDQETDTKLETVTEQLLLMFEEHRVKLDQF
jgi:hypothetical protein